MYALSGTYSYTLTHVHTNFDTCSRPPLTLILIRTCALSPTHSFVSSPKLYYFQYTPTLHPSFSLQERNGSACVFRSRMSGAMSLKFAQQLPSQATGGVSSCSYIRIYVAVPPLGLCSCCGVHEVPQSQIILSASSSLWGPFLFPIAISQCGARRNGSPVEHLLTTLL